jgi:hypothetical protein
MKINKFEYIGDGVYAMFDGYGIVLHANHHEHPTDKIYLEPQVCESLSHFVDQVKKMKEAHMNISKGGE